MTRRTFAFLAVAFAPVAGQAQRPRMTRGQTQKDQRDVAGVLAKFPGTLAGIDKKFVRLEVSGENTMEFRRTSKTAFFSGKSQVKPDRIPPGVPVVVEGTKNMAGELIVANVIWDGKSAPVTQP